MSDIDRENWEGASDEELQDGIDDGNDDAVREYASRIFGELQRAQALLRRWARKSNDVAALYSLRYETLRFIGEPAPTPPAETCPTCGGEGRDVDPGVVDRPCPTCTGRTPAPSGEGKR